MNKQMDFELNNMRKTNSRQFATANICSRQVLTNIRPCLLSVFSIGVKAIASVGKRALLGEGNQIRSASIRLLLCTE